MEEEEELKTREWKGRPEGRAVFVVLAAAGVGRSKTQIDVTNISDEL